MISKIVKKSDQSSSPHKRQGTIKMKSNFVQGLLICVGILGGAWIIAQTPIKPQPGTTALEEPKEEIPQAEYESKIKEQFDSLDGAHKKLRILVKGNMAIPNSYKTINSEYWTQGENIKVRLDYSGINIMGERSPGFIVAIVDIDGNVLKIVEQQLITTLPPSP